MRVLTGGMRHLPRREVRDLVEVVRPFSFRRREDTCTVPEMALYLATGFFPVAQRIPEVAPGCRARALCGPHRSIGACGETSDRRSVCVDGAPGRCAGRCAGADRSSVSSRRSAGEAGMAGCAACDGSQPLYGGAGGQSLWGSTDRHSQRRAADPTASGSRAFSPAYHHGGAIEHSEKSAPRPQGACLDREFGLVALTSLAMVRWGPTCGRLPRNQALADA